MKTVTRGLLAASVLCGSAQSTAAQSADDIIERHLAAPGGRPALEKVTSPRAFLGYEQAGMSVTAGDKEKVGAEAPQVEGLAQRGPFDYRHVVPLIVVSMFLVPVAIAAVLAMWFQHRSRMKALDVLRVYAERNEEPPASVTQALTGVGPHLPQARPSRLRHAATISHTLPPTSSSCWVRSGSSGGRLPTPVTRAGSSSLRYSRGCSSRRVPPHDSSGPSTRANDR